ncbi:MAG: hypothetical protein CMJ76_10280 [Planctomycetaceae bacterium]|mgnify:CR=1 FL=1|nr:hypothetical protein [Planctomycetaceae bacterium]
MTLLTFQCPVCEGVFRADEIATEVTCPHCQQTIELVDESSQTPDKEVQEKPAKVEISVRRTKSAPPLLPPGFLSPETVIDNSSPDTDQQSIAPPVLDSINNETAMSSNPVVVEGDSEVSVSEAGKRNEDVSKGPAIIINEPASKSDPAPVPSPESESESLTSVDDLVEVLGQLDSDFADDFSDSDFLPPSLDREANEPGAKVDLPTTPIEMGKVENPAVAESVSVKLTEQPQTVGHGSHKIELMSRTADEKAQFKRNKNVIVWMIGALLILLTMLVMLNLT